MNGPLRMLMFLSASLSIALVSGCASNGAETRKNQELTPLDQIPEEYATAWKAWREQAPEWSEWRPKVKADSKLANFFVDNLVRVMIKTYENSKLRMRGDLAGPFERSCRELRYLRDYSAPVMIELIPMGDTIVSYLAGDLLVQINEGRWCLPLAAKLQGGEPEDRRRAAEWLGKLPLAGEDEDAVWVLLEVTLQDPDWTVRVQGLNTIGLRARARGRVDLARPLLCKALADGNTDVVKVACLALATNQDLEGVPALINLLERGERDQQFHIIKAAQDALRTITEQEDAVGSADWRKWWSAWWKANR